jgi:hypothetical protein
MERAPSDAARRQAWAAAKRELKRFGGASFKWRTTETDTRRLWFHPADYPVRVWAAAIQPAGVVWADTEIVRIAKDRVDVRYQGELARLSRDKLARHLDPVEVVGRFVQNRTLTGHAYDACLWLRF